MARSFKSSSSYLSEHEFGWAMANGHLPCGLIGLRRQRHRQFHLGDVVQVQWQRFADLIEHRIDHSIRGLAGIRFQRNPVAFSSPATTASFLTRTLSIPLPTA